jgi:alpha-L-fucosidase
MKTYFGNWPSFVLLTLTMLGTHDSISQQKPSAGQALSRNKPERVEWFQDLAFGMFIHWSVDAPLGVVISHSLAGASADYAQRYFNELPKSFNPSKFNPQTWAALAKLAGMKYVVFTAKHHNGFCMFKTATTDFNITNTPFGRDAFKEVVDAFRKQGIAIGVYFSPEDFHVLFKQNIPIGRLQHPQHFPVNNPALMEHDKKQLRELLTQYGKIDILFIDGPGDGLREFCWDINPDLVITRDVMKTPEQTMPDQALPRPWEACYTMGTDWQFKPTNDPHKSGTQIIEMLIETRAKGGNLLLNVGPSPDGEIPELQQNLLREVALWTFVNGEAIYQIKPVRPIRHDPHWFVASRHDTTTVFSFYMRKSAKDWEYGTRNTFVIPVMVGNKDTKAEVLGASGQWVEYKENFDAGTYTVATSLGLVVSAVHAQRLYTNNQWPNPVVLKVKNVSVKPFKANASQSAMDGAK